ncbi:hypothetical protein BN946_scf184753.g45 [Trametes cinnabarina]|uniref:Major facilitator superfamily (MFS) profile domain-containing protein n=1 Tax=Pycnoporus cinnabarinus TaxID=5643 RepID=A0A060SSI1_PYCCI|nr:hypothetical protein BN946_scf184753.g45 [Trametes cinnabarina]
MTFGILADKANSGGIEDRHLEKVPGTGLLSDQGIVHGHEVVIDAAKDLKRGTGKHAHVVLIPQPSDDPRDPLNWPTWKKEACFWTLAFAASLDGALSPMVGPGYVLLAKQFNVSVDNITSSFGFILLGLGTFIPNLASIRASRLFQGFGMSALQSLVASTLEQIYCVHERGSRAVIWSFAIMAGITLGPLICSYVIQNLSWEFGFWFVSIPLGMTMIMVFFFVPETWFLFLTHGMQTVWLSLVPLCSSTIFTLEYNFDAAQIGLTNLGGIVGIVLAMLVTGPLNDWGVVWISRRNRGIYEPEFRLLFMVSMLFGLFGYVGWAVGNDHHMPWIGAVACIMMLNFSMVVSGSAAVTYLLDTHGENALHILALSNFGKNMVLYGSTFFANGMVLSRGVKVSLLILGACQAFCCLASVPMYIFGKRVRSFIARHPQVFGRNLPVEESVTRRK